MGDDIKKMEDDLKKSKKWKTTKKKWMTNQSTKINLIGCDTIAISMLKLNQVEHKLSCAEFSILKHIKIPAFQYYKITIISKSSSN